MDGGKCRTQGSSPYTLLTSSRLNTPSRGILRGGELRPVDPLRIDPVVAVTAAVPFQTVRRCSTYVSLRPSLVSACPSSVAAVVDLAQLKRRLLLLLPLLLFPPPHLLPLYPIMDNAFRKLDVDQYSEDRVLPTDLYTPDPRSPSQVLAATQAKLTAVRGFLQRGDMSSALGDALQAPPFGEGVDDSKVSSHDDQVTCGVGAEEGG